MGTGTWTLARRLYRHFLKAGGVLLLALLIQSAVQGQAQPLIFDTTPPVEAPRAEGIPINDNGPGLIPFWICIGSAAVLAFIRILEPEALGLFLRSAFRTDLLMKNYLEGKFAFNVTSLLLDAVFCAVVGCLIHLALPGSELLLTTSVTAAAYFIKLGVMQALSYLFFDKGDALWHPLMHLLFTRLGGIALVPLLAWAAYGTPDAAWGAGVVLTAAAASFLLWMGRLVWRLNPAHLGDVLYHAVYLCTLEASPLLLLYRRFFNA